MSERNGKRVLFVSNEESRTGAPMFLLHFLRWLKTNTSLSFEILLAKGGPLEAEFAKLGKVHGPAAFLRDTRALQTFDLIYANTCCNGALLELLPYGNVPIVTHVHELDYGFESMGAPHWAEVIRQSHRYIACARVVAERLEQIFRIPPERIGVHYEMIDPTPRGPVESAAALRQKYGIPAEALVVAACGTCDLRKGADLFVQLAAALQRRWTGERPLHYLWIGKSVDGNLDRILRHDARRSGLSQLTFTGEVENPSGLLSLCEVFCLVSREDPFPLAMLEAAALAKPVVCFERAGGAVEFAALGGGVAVPFLDVGAMAEACDGLLRDPDRRAAMGRHGAESVQNNFTVETVAPALWREIEQFLASPAPAPEARVRQASFAEIFLTWNLAEAPDREYVRLHLARHEEFARARARVAEGKPGEAMPILLAAVRAVIKGDVPVALLEALAEVSEELAPLDAGKARYFLAQAESLAAKGSARIEFRPASPTARAPRRVRVLGLTPYDSTPFAAGDRPR